MRDRRIHAFAALRPDTGGRLVHRSGDVEASLKKLDALAEGAAFLLGHNLIAFDLPHLKAANPDLRLLKMPAVDTLRLNPLAFPRNPYHQLVKHYQDGQLKHGRVNDPELDARLTLELFRDQWRALERAARQSPYLVAAWHWLTTREGDRSGFNTFFSSLRGALRPSDARAREAIRVRLAEVACRTPRTRDRGRSRPPRLGAGVRAGMAVGVRRQFGDAARGCATSSRRRVGSFARCATTACTDPGCGWCRERHDARKELTRWFGFEDFRPEPFEPDTRRPPAALDRRGGDGREARSGYPAYGDGQVAVLPDPRPVPATTRPAH